MKNFTYFFDTKNIHKINMSKNIHKINNYEIDNYIQSNSTTRSPTLSQLPTLSKP